MATYPNEIMTYTLVPIHGEETGSLVFPLESMDEIAPTVSNIYPVDTSQLASGTAVTFDVTDNDTLSDVIVYAVVSGRWEVIYGGTQIGFAPGYSGSSATPIIRGISFSISRNGGWSGGVRFCVVGFDTGGNQTL